MRVSDETTNNNDLSQILEVLANSDNIAYVNFTYIALQNNHGQVNFSTIPVSSKKHVSIDDDNHK